MKKAGPSEAMTSGSSSTVSPVPSHNHELAFMRCSDLLHAGVKAYPKGSHNFYHDILVPCHGIMQIYMYFRAFFIF